MSRYCKSTSENSVMFNTETWTFGPFKNGYRAFVSRDLGTNGGDKGLLELAVFHGMEIVFDTPVTDDVVVNLSWKEVLDLVKKIKVLPPRTTVAP